MVEGSNSEIETMMDIITTKQEEAVDITIKSSSPSPEAVEGSLASKEESNEGDESNDSKYSKEESENQETAVKVEEIQEVDTRTEEEKAKEEKEKELAEKKRVEELKKKYADWPLRNIKEPHENDVMYGRGGGTNHHPGNKRYRKMVDDRKLEYVNCKRLDKPLVALEIIRLWRAQLPPGRFLKLDEKTGLWHDVGDKKAREKTSQALREKAPLIRKQQEDEQNDEDEDEDEKEQDDGSKTTRFAEGTKGGEPSTKVKRAVLARDHSLGREYLASGEAVSLEGFSWQDPFRKGGDRNTSMGSVNGTIPAPPSHAGAPYAPPAGRNSSSGSIGMAPPYHQTSIGMPPGPPPPPDYYGRIPSAGPQRREFSNSSLGSLGAPFPYPPPPPPGVPGHYRSGSWTNSIPPSSPHQPGHHQRSGSWSGRDHSLSFNPLIGASVARPAERFGSSGYWGDMSPTARGTLPHPPPPPPPGAYLPYMSGGSAGPPLPVPYRNPSPSNSNTPSPPYNVDMNIARSWSGGEVRTSWSGEYPPQHEVGPPTYEGHPRPANGPDSSPPRQLPYGYAPGGSTNSHIPRPNMVKRDTSNQNETIDTKPSIKKAALNRDQSATSNRLKQEYMPDYYNRRFDTEREMQTLQETTEQIRLSPGPPLREQPRPRALNEENRVSTLDVIAMDLMARPSPFSADGRLSTIDALDLDLDGSDSVIRTDDMDDKTDGSQGAMLPKPSALGANNRLTTQEFLDIVTSPIAAIDDKISADEDPLPFVR